MYTMNNLPSQSREQVLSNETAEVLPLEPKAEWQEPSSDVNTLFTFPLDESTSVVAEAKIDTESNVLNILLTNCNLVTVGRSDTQQLKCNCHLQEENNCVSNSDNGVRSDSAPKIGDSADCSLRGRKPTEYQLQPFNETAEHCKPVNSDEIVVSVEPLLPLIKKQGYLNGSQCEKIMEQLEILQDNGKFGEHEGLVISYLRRCGEKKNSDLELALKIERGVAFSYHKEFKKSKQMFISVIKSDKDKERQLRNRNILIARAYFLLVEGYRSRKFVKLSLLFELLRRSEFFLQNHESPEDWAELYYNYGSVWRVYMSMIPDDERNAQARNTARGNARYYYEQAISFCKKDPRLRVQIKKQTYIHLNLAALLLDCSSTAARTRQKVIPPVDIKEAKEHLDFVQYKLGVCLPLGTLVQLLKTRSDQFYRQEIYQLAKETAEEALQVALYNEFNTEIDTLQERIGFLDKLCEERIRVIAIKEISSSSSEAFCNESTETE